MTLVGGGKGPEEAPFRRFQQPVDLVLLGGRERTGGQVTDEPAGQVRKRANQRG